ncbi:transglutaminaseTgpA domain-containing protein [Blastococcus mobilis]|uniref:Transglutaminase-like superfamily protein n=1 Tax=Blastococcus mobilis TaxID=1938746 RepID=A0A238VHB9_9ACTN|nr:transglutaminaseTgpA domain-containing protein [Blastococcus mobilis]SNR33802.1 Transglutaminase-like superfamily protein [Blastococcus mobilis]
MNDQDVRTAGAAALATLLGAAALTPVYTSAAWLGPVVAVVLTVLAGGLLLRAGGAALRTGLTRGRAASDDLSALGVVLVPVGQLALVLCVLTALFAPARAVAGLLPTEASLRQLAAVLSEGLAELREQATPALPLTGLLALTAVFVGLIAVLVDLVTVAGRQGGLAGLGLLVLYCVPVVTITGTIGLVALVAPAAGLALLLWTDQRRRLADSGRATRRALGTGGVAALRIGAVALVAGLVLGPLVPTLTEGSLATGLGGGSGSATGTSLDPVAAMQGQLTLPEPIHLLQVETSVEDPGHLRAVAIDEYDNESGWTLSNMRGEESVADDDRLAPLPERLSNRPVTVTIQVLEHDDRFLPMPFSPLSVRLDDDGDDGWRFDPDTGTVYGREVTSGGRSYTVTAVEPRPTAAELAEARPLAPGSPIQQQFTALPLLDPRVTDRVAEVTAGADTPYERVSRIHGFLTDRANGFTYSLSTAPGTSGDDLVDFLQLRRGYCEQYAGAMAVMVRAAGVPARVALGYTPGTERDDGSRLITSDDAHAWVEVYFEDLGWVPFDPTPIARDRAVDLPWAPRADERDDTDGRAEAPAPTVPARPLPSVPQHRDPGAAPTVPSGQGADDLLWRLAGGLGITALAGALVATPAGVRALQRRRRVAAGTAGALWDELTASALDAGVRLHPAWTPRQSARELGAVLARSGASGGPGTDAVVRLALAEEAASYGPTAGERAHPDLPVALQTARKALLGSLPPGKRLRARIWPASLVSGAGSRLVAEAGRRLSLHRIRRGRRTRTV